MQHDKHFYYLHLKNVVLFVNSLSFFSEVQKCGTLDNLNAFYPDRRLRDAAVVVKIRMTIVESPSPETVTVDDSKCYIMRSIVFQVNGKCIGFAV